MDLLETLWDWSEDVASAIGLSTTFFLLTVGILLICLIFVLVGIRHRWANVISLLGCLFLTGIGEVFPFVRSHTVLNNLQTVVSEKPMLMFFPGRYEVSATQGSALVLFGQLKDDSFYRAKRILDQEA